MKLSIVIPAYNEEKRLLRNLKKVFDFSFVTFFIFKFFMFKNAKFL